MRRVPARTRAAFADWIGAHRPIEIILFMVAIVAAIAFIAHLM